MVLRVIVFLNFISYFVIWSFDHLCWLITMLRTYFIFIFGPSSILRVFTFDAWSCELYVNFHFIFIYLVLRPYSVGTLANRYASPSFIMFNFGISPLIIGIWFLFSDFNHRVFTIVLLVNYTVMCMFKINIWSFE